MSISSSVLLTIDKPGNIEGTRHLLSIIGPTLSATQKLNNVCQDFQNVYNLQKSVKKIINFFKNRVKICSVYLTA